jgi:hypothetical protein
LVEICGHPDRAFSPPSWEAVFKTKKQAGFESGLSELGFWRLTAESRSDLIEIGRWIRVKVPLSNPRSILPPMSILLAPSRLATRAWVAEKRDYRVLRRFAQ